MKVKSSVDDHLITIEDAQNGVLWHFAVGATQGFRFLNAQASRPGGPVPGTGHDFYNAAETAAKDFARQNGWLGG